ncbi:nitrate/nitrite transporter NrtS [Colwellia sp. RE-S-Sl-9]
MLTTENSNAATWLQIATRPDIIKRSIKISLIVGSFLAVLNHGDKLLTVDLSSLDIFKIIATYFVPFCVSTYSSLQNELHAMRRQ